MKNMFTCLVVAGGLFSAVAANASVVTQFSLLTSFDRSCPGLSDPNYIGNWESSIRSLFKAGPTTPISVDDACRFNSKFQAQYFNADGSGKFPHLLPGVPFSEADVGVLSITDTVGTDYVFFESQESGSKGQVKLDPLNLGLPEIKVAAFSNENERNSMTATAATEYLWTGADETLEFTINYDFFSSGDMWSMAGLSEVYGQEFNLYFGVNKDMVFDPLNIWASDYGTEIVSNSFRSSQLPATAYEQDSPFVGSLTVSFDVKTGDEFFLWSDIQAVGKNGGFMDAYHTVTSDLTITGMTSVESRQIFKTALQPAPRTSVPEPAGVAVLGAVLLLLARRKNS